MKERFKELYRKHGRKALVLILAFYTIKGTAVLLAGKYLVTWIAGFVD